MGIKKLFKKQYKMLVEPLSDGKHTARELKTGLRSVVNDLRRNRDPKASNAPDMDEFQDVLEHWEVQPEHIDKVIRSLKLRTTLLAIMGLVGIYIFVKALIDGGFLLLISGTALMVLGSVALVTGAWRINVLEERRFTPFANWIGSIFHK